jgi:uncharacterized protein CbrC (UPF0167 family)
MSHSTMFNTVAPMRNHKESQADPSSQCCPNPSCTGGVWHVQCLSVAAELWQVSSETGGSYLIAGVTPACPWCGSDLAVAAKADATPPANGLLQRIGGTFQPRQAESELPWN